MKTLYLIRHAKSSWKNPVLADKKRPLNKRGKKDAPEMGRRLADKHIQPDLLLSSPATRAKKTARKIAKKMGHSKEEVRLNDKLYMAEAIDMLEVIRRLDDEQETVCIFGHNPGMTELAEQLSGMEIENVPTCGIVAIGFDTDHWQQVGKRQGELLFFDYPKKAA